MSNCPNCQHAVLTPVTSGLTRPRPEVHTVVQCGNCSEYALLHKSGRVFHLADPNDPDSDAVTRRVV